MSNSMGNGMSNSVVNSTSGSAGGSARGDTGGNKGETLVITRRGPIPDLCYLGNVAVCDSAGKLLYYAGDPSTVAYARSSAKPMQAFSVFESGAVSRYALTGPEISLVCASHSGEDMHINGVRGILARAGVPENALQCGAHYPSYRPAEVALIRAGLEPMPIHNNCSGKHTGMLITAAAYGEDYKGYMRPEHPVQRRILKNIASICEFPAEDIIIGVDGCGVPVHALPLRKFAHGTARLAKPDTLGDRAYIALRIAEEMNAYPEMMSGTGRACAAIMRAAEGRVFVKGGADGYYMCGVRGEGIGIAVKMTNHAQNIPSLVLIETLRQLGVLDDRQLGRLSPAFYGMEIRNTKDDVVGVIEPRFTLKKAV